MILKTYYKTKDYCKVKFSFKIDNAETVQIRGLNSDWQKSSHDDQEERWKFHCRRDFTERFKASVQICGKRKGMAQ